jgi:hypothetical protein
VNIASESKMRKRAVVVVEKVPLTFALKDGKK